MVHPPRTQHDELTQHYAERLFGILDEALKRDRSEMEETEGLSLAGGGRIRRVQLFHAPSIFLDGLSRFSYNRGTRIVGDSIVQKVICWARMHMDAVKSMGDRGSEVFCLRKS
jgi:hypothetical protein